MTTNLTSAVCPACGGRGKDRRYQIEEYDLHRCERCGTEFLVLSDDREPASHTYWDGYKFRVYGDEQVRAQYEERYRSVMASARRYTSTIRRVVDVGCGIGNFLDWVRTEGLEGTGVDVEQDAIDSCRERGLDAVHLDELPDRVPAGSVDMVTLWDVIEHVHDPRGMVEDLVPYLRPGGIMAFETPDVSFPVRPAVIAIRKVAEPIRWSDMLYYKNHLVYFSADGIRTLLESAGLEVMEVRGMRSPQAKMRQLFEVWADKGVGAGKLGPALYEGLDGVMRRVHMTNKLIVVARKPWE